MVLTLTTFKVILVVTQNNVNQDSEVGLAKGKDLGVGVEFATC